MQLSNTGAENHLGAYNTKLRLKKRCQTHLVAIKIIPNLDTMQRIHWSRNFWVLLTAGTTDVLSHQKKAVYALYKHGTKWTTRLNGPRSVANLTQDRRWHSYNPHGT